VGTNGGLIATLPRLKGQFALDWDYGPMSVTGQVNYIHKYWETAIAGTRFIPNDPSFQNGRYPDKVPSYTTYNLYGKYQFTKNLAIYGSIVNLTNELPPYDPGFSSTYNYDFSTYDPRGRQYRLGLTYKM
jgi:iron complex outermembrane receptor protein